MWFSIWYLMTQGFIHPKSVREPESGTEQLSAQQSGFPRAEGRSQSTPHCNMSVLLLQSLRLALYHKLVFFLFFSLLCNHNSMSGTWQTFKIVCHETTWVNQANWLNIKAACRLQFQRRGNKTNMRGLFQEDRKEHMKCEEQTEKRNSQTIFNKGCHRNCVQFHMLKIRWEKLETAACE